jgi:hypothetical protein
MARGCLAPLALTARALASRARKRCPTQFPDCPVARVEEIVEAP